MKAVLRVSLCFSPTCYSEGMEHMVSVTSCECESLAVALVRARLWPASPQFPEYAFSFDLLDWAEALLLECHVSLKDFCSALYFRCPYSVEKVVVFLFFVFPA